MIQGSDNLLRSIRELALCFIVSTPRPPPPPPPSIRADQPRHRPFATAVNHLFFFLYSLQLFHGESCGRPESSLPLLPRPSFTLAFTSPFFRLSPVSLILIMQPDD